MICCTPGGEQIAFELTSNGGSKTMMYYTLFTKEYLDTALLFLQKRS
jgi:hypothetical protein